MNTRITPYRFFIFSVVTIVVLTACQPKGDANTTQSLDTAPTGTQSDTPADGPKVLNANLNLDPALAQDADSLMASEYLYEGLVRRDSSGAPQPAVAESWVVSDDVLDYVFTLRPNAVFSDGTRITPEIIADNFNRWFDPLSPLRGNGDYATWERNFLGFHGEKDPDNRAKSTVDGIQVVDMNTVLVHLNRPVPDLLTLLADPAFAILKPSVLADPAYGRRGSTIISSGPYIVSGWTDSELTLSPNSSYWGPVPSGDLTFILQ